MSILNKQPKFVAATCPKCGGVLELDASFEVAYCSECGTQCFIQNVKKKKVKKNAVPVDESFDSDTAQFSTNDFDDFSDLKESGFTSVLVKILIFLIVVIVILGGIVLANIVFDLGLF